MKHSALALVTLALAGCTVAPRSAATHAPVPVVAADLPAGSTVVVVRVAMPWYAPRFYLRKKFHDVLPEYDREAGLETKYFTISDDRYFGGVYLFASRERADAHFDAAWHARVREKRGVSADVRFYEARQRIEALEPLGGAPEGARGIAYDGTVSFAFWPLDDTGASTLKSWAPDGLVKAYVVSWADRTGVVALWRDRDRAERGAGTAHPGVQVAFSEAPLLVDARLRGDAAR